MSFSIMSDMDPLTVLLDLLLPAEFAQLLNARVQHLLSGWPLHSIPLDLIHAFVTFFRPNHETSAVQQSLTSLHTQLESLQALFSYLSPVELKNIVLSRLSDNARDRSTAVQAILAVIKFGAMDSSNNVLPQR